IVHVADALAASRWAGDWPEAAEALAEAFWPGPLTLILPRAANVPDEVTGGQDTVGLRVPAHPVAQALLRAFEGGVAAPSANRFGHISPTTAQHVRDEFGDAVPVVLDGGECEIGLESTIVDLSGETPRILRPGKISRPEIEAIIGPVAEGANGDSPRASGTLASHYAPRAQVEVLARAPLVARYKELQKRGQRVAALLRGQPFKDIEGEVLPADLAGYGHALYAALRRLDARGFEVLLAELPPHTAAWAAVNDRLRRASAPRDADGT
ncbi:L-threonylcarbamoyladenylate synthase, partial [Silanimonas lenta]|uniref:L-threonylcarbamoyladenylate synthase n=1 Tax=Silanimonas lenta TaxID=265429 RepID=UPI002FE0F206